jgi:hypothetical protein
MNKINEPLAIGYTSINLMKANFKSKLSLTHHLILVMEIYFDRRKL